jgi:hypothetical protein
MRYSIKILFICLLILNGCTDDSDRSDYYFGYPDPGSSNIQGQNILDQYTFEWMTGKHKITGYPFISNNSHILLNDNYHIGFTIILHPKSDTSTNVITQHQTYWQLIKKKDGITQEFINVFNAGVGVNNDTLSVIYDGYHFTDSIWDYQLKCTFIFDYKYP